MLSAKLGPSRIASSDEVNTRHCECPVTRACAAEYSSAPYTLRGMLWFLLLVTRISAAPLQTPCTNLDPAAPSCVCPFNQGQRSLWDIIWGCLVTIFACTWISVHPNIPKAGGPWWKSLASRLKIMFYAIITPEMVIWWAMRQWLGAGDIEKRHKGDY